MTLLLLILTPLTGGLLAWLVGRRSDRAARVTSLAALLIMGVLALAPLLSTGEAGTDDGGWLTQVRIAWLPQLGSDLHLGVDGLSLPLVLLTVVLGLVAVLASWTEITHRVGFFHLNLLAVLAGVVGVFLALDLLALYLFWELMLIPMALLIAVWGHAERRRAALTFALFTQAAGLILLVAIVAVVLAHREATGVLTWDLAALRAGPRQAATMLPMLGFVVAFAVKLPAVPVHTWLPLAHTEAPTAGSVVLAGLLLKTGAYGLLRFAVPLFPEASVRFAPWGLALGVVGILWGAWLALGQRDLKRLVAYTSVSHMGFVLLGVYALDGVAWRGVLLQLIAHGLSTGGLFVVAGLVQARTGTRQLADLGGLWPALPRLGGLSMVLVMASLGLPGLANFVAEFLVLLGTFRVQPLPAILAALGLVAATVYALWLMQRTFHGEPRDGQRLFDLDARETATLAGCVVVLVWLGLAPGPLLDLAGPPLEGLRAAALPALSALTGGSAP
jgi:NADH-quinone oxidoreductase subunit M